MKTSLTLVLLTCFVFGNAQVTDVPTLEPKEDYENIHAEKLHTDSLSTSLIIWIKKSVRLHKHAFHSETIMVLEGQGEMKIGDQLYKVGTGDHFNIPKNTPHSLKVTSEKPMKVLSFQSPEFVGKDRIFLD